MSGPFVPDYPLRFGSVLLRPLTTDDLDAVHAYQGDPDAVRYVPYGPRSRDDVRAVLSDPAKVRSVLQEPGQALNLGVVATESGALVGGVVLIWTSDEHRTAEIGWIFSAAHRGRGYATDAARALLVYAFEAMDLHRVVARLDARNAASARLCRRLGMRQEAHLVQNEMFKGEWADELDFAILRAEWSGSTTPVAR